MPDPAGRNGSRFSADHLTVPAASVRNVLADSVAAHCGLVQVEKVFDLPHDSGQPPRLVEVLHEVLAGGHQVDEDGYLRPEPVEVGQLEVDLDPPSDRQQVDDGIGRAANGGIDPYGVLERGAGHDR